MKPSISRLALSIPRHRWPRPPSELTILFGAFALLVIGALLSVALQLGAPDGPPLSARAYGVTGSVALSRWVSALGYETKVVEGRPYRLPQDMRLLFLLQPNALYPLGEAEQDELEGWVRDGGILALAVERYVAYPVTRRGPAQIARGDVGSLRVFGFALPGDETGTASVITLTMQEDLAPGIVVGDFQVRANNALSAPADATVLAADNRRVIIASREVGRGRVIAFATTYPFSNEGLRDEGNGRLMLSLLRLAPPGSLVGFDEYQHGARQTPSLFAWLVTTPTGQGTALALALLAVYILWTGRRFGRVFVPPELRIRRQPSEYVVAMANLARAAGQQQATLLRYRDWLKRRLGKPYRIDPNLNDEEFVAELAQADAGMDRERLLVLLRELSAAPRRLSLAQFVRLARDASEFG